MEQQNIIFEQSYIESKKQYIIKYQQIIYIFLGFVMGQAELFTGICPFSLLYWTFFINRPKILLMVTGTTTAGLLWQGEFHNIIYIAAGVLGLLFYKGVEKLFSFSLKEINCLALFISITFFILVVTLNHVKGLSIYYDMLRLGESAVIFLLIILMRRSIPKLFDKSYFSYNKNLTIMLLSCAFLLGIGSFFTFFRGLVETAVIILVVVISYLVGIQAGIFLASFYGMFFMAVGVIPQISLIKFVIYGFVAGLLPFRKKNGLLLALGISLLFYSGFSPTFYEFKRVGFETAIAGIIILMSPITNWKKLINIFYNSDPGLVKTNFNRDYHHFFKKRIKELSLVFSELSTTFSEVLPCIKGEKKKRIRDFIFLFRHKNCLKCKRRKYCWLDNKQSTEKGIINLLKYMENDEKKMLSSNTILSRCPEPVKVITGANSSYELYQINNFWRDKMLDKQKIVSEQLQGISDIIDDFSANPSLDINYSLVFKKIREKMLLNELDVYDIKVHPDFNSDKINLYLKMEPCAGNEPCRTQLPELIENEFGSKFRIIKKECGSKLKDRPCYLKYAEFGNLYLEIAVRQYCSQEICGDTYRHTTLGNGKDLIVISDGMGTGEGAARESRAAVRLLERIIMAGFDQALAVDTINSALFLRNQEEKFTTLDLAFFDTFTGEVVFNKIGSVSSFIKSKKNAVKEIKPSSLPVGILEKVDSTVIEEKLNPEDIVVMVSDGVMDAFSKTNGVENWFSRMLQGASIDNPEILADYLFDTVKEKGNVIDDMTIIVFKAKEIKK